MEDAYCISGGQEILNDMVIRNKNYDEERALYGSRDITVTGCRFDGPADGESAFKECRNVIVKDSFFNLRYPFWHDDKLELDNIEMTENCRAALWYTNDATIRNSRMHGIKALRECSNIRIENCDIISPEFGWSVKGIEMKDTGVQGEYFMMRSERLHFENITLKGKYSFQYISDSVFENCNFDTKDAFWHARNVVVRNSIVKGEYLAWYCENVTFENCTIIGIQPLCYCKGLRIVNCRMIDANLAFEKSEVDATITTPVISIMNPLSGVVRVPEVSEIIMDDENAAGKIVVGGIEMYA